MKSILIFWFIATFIVGVSMGIITIVKTECFMRVNKSSITCGVIALFSFMISMFVSVLAGKI